MTEDEPPGGMAILGKAGAVLEALTVHGDLPASAIADAVREPVSSTYRLLAQLVGVGWVDRGGARNTFRIAGSFLQLGALLEDQMSVRQASEQALVALQRATHLTSFLCVLRATGAVCIDRYDGRGVRLLSMQIGDSLPLDRGGAPLALLAHAPLDKQTELVASLTTSAKSAAALQRRLSEIRDAGFAWSDQDVTPGVAAVGAPVFNHRGELEGAISVSGLRNHLIEARKTMEQLVADAAASASSELGFTGRRPSGGTTLIGPGSSAPRRNDVS